MHFLFVIVLASSTCCLSFFHQVGPLEQYSVPAVMDVPIDLDAGSNWHASSGTIERHDYEHDFIMTVAVPLSFALGLLLIFSFVVFCNREGM